MSATGALDRTMSAPAATGGSSAGVVAPARRRRAPGLDFLFTAVFAVFGLGVGFQRLSDNSYFTHLVTGRWILDHGIPREDFYSYTAPGTKWVAQSWLAEVLYAQLDRSFGGFGVRLLGALATAAIAVLAFRLALRCSRDRVRAALVTVAALTGMVVLWSERPLLLGLLCLMGLLWVVEVPDCFVGRHPIVVLPALFWFWANVHGSFALGFAYLALHLVGRWADGARPWQGRERRILVASAIAAGVTFANPYGPALVFFPLRLLGRGDILRHVTEWKSPDFHSIWGQSFLVWLAVFVIVVARSRNRVTRRDLVVTVPFLLLGLWALRNVAIAPLVCLPVVARAVAVDPEAAEARRNEERRGGIAWVLAALLGVIGFALVSQAAAQPDFATASYPVKAVRALEDRGLIGRRLLLDDGAAAYVELEYFPRQRVFLDDRFDMFPPAVIWDYLELADGGARTTQILDRYGVETVVWEKGKALAENLRQSGNWTEIHRDRTWATFVRNDIP